MTHSDTIHCVYPNGFQITKKDMEEVKKFGKIVLNYLKIKRIDRLPVNPFLVKK